MRRVRRHGHAGWFDAGCHFCWEEYRRDKRVGYYGFTCDRCGAEDCTTGGQFGRQNLCFACYQVEHAGHFRDESRCGLCLEGRLSRNKS